MKEFINKHAEILGGLGVIIPALYWLFIWKEINFSVFNFLFIVLLPVTIAMWIWVIYRVVRKDKVSAVAYQLPTKALNLKTKLSKN